MRLVVLAIDGADGDVRTVQSGLVRFLEEKVGKEKEVFTGVYRNTGAGGQPDMHPVIEQMMGGAKWLILTLVVDKTGEMEKEQMDDLVGNWVKGMNGESRKIEHGVWNGELVMG